VETLLECALPSGSSLGREEGIHVEGAERGPDVEERKLIINPGEKKS
jgi:hypothetical protein